MRLLRFIVRVARGAAVGTGVVSAISGLFNAGLIAVVHRALTGGGDVTTLAFAFVVLGLGKLVSGYYSEVLLTRYAQQAVAAMRVQLVERLLAVPHERFVAAGPARIYASLTDDVGQIGQTLYQLPAFAVNVAILGGGGLYLLYLSPIAVVVLGVMTVLGAGVHRALTRRARRAIDEARREHDVLVDHFVTLTRGIKELKLHRPRREAFVRDELTPSTQRLVEHNVIAHARYIFAHSTSHFFFFVLIGAVLFGAPSVAGADQTVITGYVLTCLYLLGPLSGAINALPQFASADVALKRIDELGVELDALPDEPVGASAATWEGIELKGVTRGYHHERHGTEFTLGPVDLTLKPGEVLFVTGSNGSGKSTLARIITGLDTPDAGELLWDGKPVDDDNRDDYRQLFSTVFSDYFLFSSLLGLDAEDLDARAAGRLEDLQLSHKVKIEGGVLSSTELSQGQRKRLALLTAYLEDRPIYVFDEWAADQDPEFKRIFYHELIPELQRAGKTVLVITHDDRYFGLAERAIRLVDGKLD